MPNKELETYPGAILLIELYTLERRHNMIIITGNNRRHC